jgi:hypothetical protein
VGIPPFGITTGVDANIGGVVSSLALKLPPTNTDGLEGFVFVLL